MTTSTSKRGRSSLRKWLATNWLIVGELIVILLAWHNPALGATGGPLRPELTISKLAVMAIFFINGVALKGLGGSSSAEDINKSVRTNGLVQLFNYGVMPLLTRLLVGFYPDAAFRDGMLLLSVLPCTINISVAQTLSAGGNMGTAIFNAVFGNVLGVFLTPLLAIIQLGGSSTSVSLVKTLGKLGVIVILPLLLGQLARFTAVGEVVEKNTAKARTFSTLMLLAIVYNIFCDTFQRGIGIPRKALVTLLVAMPGSYLVFTALFYAMTHFLLPGLDAQTRGAALLVSSSKTLAFGIPFIKTAMGNRADIAYVLAPLLLYAPAQLILGSSLVAPRVRSEVAKQSIFEDGGGI